MDRFARIKPEKDIKVPIIEFYRKNKMYIKMMKAVVIKLTNYFKRKLSLIADNLSDTSEDEDSDIEIDMKKIKKSR